eukprot:CAMPEP_0185179072 /NCGR_PEP_ID=MMETSP1139-20130426/31827_1 /TAXON_ID=298111 /ORGANISM="Pavlova sp., Strain CCMP459" /LENGTH=672 /DNA_ID=CAMNT_0027744907 /DNA_START=152 /DNA_END=2171 /DNA_ORIENTATION=-
MTPVWEQAFEVEDISRGAKVVVDVWNARNGQDPGDDDEYFGKVSMEAADLGGGGGTAEWHEIVQGRVLLEASFEEVPDAWSDGDESVSEGVREPDRDEAQRAALKSGQAPAAAVTGRASDNALQAPAVPGFSMGVAFAAGQQKRPLPLATEGGPFTSGAPARLPQLSSAPASTAAALGADSKAVEQEAVAEDKSDAPASTAAALGADSKAVEQEAVAEDKSEGIKPAEPQNEADQGAVFQGADDVVVDDVEELADEEYSSGFDDESDTQPSFRKAAQVRVAGVEATTRELTSEAREGGPGGAVESAPAHGDFRVDYYEYTHKGGDGTGPKENQDTMLTLNIDARNWVWAVFDGHGHDNGRIASEAARDFIRAFFQNIANFDRLRRDPEAAMRAACEGANEAVKSAILSQPGVWEEDGHIVQEMEVDEYCPLGYDVVDGGTTATIAALVDGRTLVYAMIGDSCGVLASTLNGRVHARELVPEHSALNQAEYEKLRRSGLLFVYEYPDMYDLGHLPVWEEDAEGKVVLSQESIEQVDSYGLGFKTERGDRAAFLLTPEMGNFSQMSLALTRSIGDFYHQEFGVKPDPEVVVLDLKDVQPASPKDGGSVLLIASDGVWDHWTFEAAMTMLINPRTGRTDRDRAMRMFEETRAKGEEVFGDTADNLTAIAVVFPRV